MEKCNSVLTCSKQMGKGLLTSKAYELLFKLKYTEVAKVHSYSSENLKEIQKSMSTTLQNALKGDNDKKNYHFYLATAETGKLANRTVVTDSSLGDDDTMVGMFEAGPNSKSIDCMCILAAIKDRTEPVPSSVLSDEQTIRDYVQEIITNELTNKQYYSLTNTLYAKNILSAITKKITDAKYECNYYIGVSLTEPGVDYRDGVENTEKENVCCIEVSYKNEEFNVMVIMGFCAKPKPGENGGDGAANEEGEKQEES